MDELGSSLEHSPHFLCLLQGPGVCVGAVLFLGNIAIQALGEL